MGSPGRGKWTVRHGPHSGRTTVKRKLLALFVIALVPLAGAVACGGVEEEIRQRADEEIDRGRQRVEQEIDEGRTRVEQEVTQRVSEGVREAEQRAREGVQEGQQRLEEGQQ